MQTAFFFIIKNKDMFENIENPATREALEHAHHQAIKEQIDSLNLEEMEEVLTNIEDALQKNPDLLKDPIQRSKIEKAQQRLSELLERNPDTLH